MLAGRVRSIIASFSGTDNIEAPTLLGRVVIKSMKSCLVRETRSPAALCHQMFKVDKGVEEVPHYRRSKNDFSLCLALESPICKNALDSRFLWWLPQWVRCSKERQL